MCLLNININNIGRYMRGGNSVLVDLRDYGEFCSGHIPGAVNIPYEELERRKCDLTGYDRILLYCERGNNSLLASRQLSREGYNVVNLYGGIHAYRGRLAVS